MECGWGAENIWSLKQFSEEQGQENRKQSQLSCKLFELLIDYVFCKSTVPRAQKNLTNYFKRKKKIKAARRQFSKKKKRSIFVFSLTFIFHKSLGISGLPAGTIIQLNNKSKHVHSWNILPEVEFFKC